MTLKKATDIIKILLDKYGSPSMDTEELLELLSMATYEYLNRLFPDTQGGITNIETDAQVMANLAPLIWDINVTTDAQGHIERTELDQAVRTVSAYTTSKLFRVLAAAINVDGDFRPVKFQKNNNRWSDYRNVFKRPSIQKPVYRIYGDGLNFDPAGVHNVTLTVVRTPRLITPDMLNQEMEFSDYVYYNILSIALKLVAISVRDTEIIEDARLAGLQISQ